MQRGRLAGAHLPLEDADALFTRHLVDLGEDVRGLDAVAADAALKEGSGDVARQAEHGVLGHDVHRAALQAAQRGGRGHVDDVGRGALLEEDLDGVLAAQVHGALVGLVDHVIDFLRGFVNGELTVKHAGVVDQNVQVAEFFETGVEHGVDLRRIAHVRLDRQDDAGGVLRRDFVAQVFQPLQAARRGDDLGALHGEQPRGGAADAGTRAGHDDDLAFKTHFFHGICPPCGT